MKLADVEFFKVSERVLRKEFVAIQERIDVGVRELKTEQVIDEVSRRVGSMVYRLSGYVWAEEIQNETVSFRAEYPGTWCQHFKQRWYPQWAIRRWPVKMEIVERTHTFKTIALLPGFKYVAPPGTGKHVIKTQVGLK